MYTQINKVSKHQHGFVKGKSCLTNLLETVDCVIDLLDEGAPVDILILQRHLTVFHIKG